MDVRIETSAYLPCEVNVFTINGKGAYVDDFGYSEDSSIPVNVDDAYVCQNRRFIPYYDRPIDGMLDEYNITLDEYNQICDMLEDKLYIGSCGLCL